MSGNKLKPLRLWSAVWGEKHFEWFKRAALTSLAWPKNRAALEGATWDIVTLDEDRERIQRAIEESGIRIANVEFITLGPEFRSNPHAAGAYLNQAWLLFMNHCITVGAQCFMAPPDTIVGDGSVQHLREVARQRDTVVFAAHMRVTPDILESALYEFSTRAGLSNARLVSLGMEHAHKTWTDAQDGLGQINSYVGGIVWKYLSENLWSVCHRLPTPYLINFTPEDLVYFKNQIHFGVLDHSWPAECLIDTERQRVMGSSDGAFFVELTEPDQNIPPVSAYHQDCPDHFWRNQKHNKVNRMNSIILRGEP